MNVSDPVLASARDLVGESVTELRSSIRGLLRSTDEVDWAAMRETRGRGGDAPPQVTAAYALIHPTEHLRGHVDQMALMRHLWQQNQA